MSFSYKEIILRTFSSLPSFRQAAIRHRCRRKPIQLNKRKALRFYEAHKHWNQDYLESTYILVFSTTVVSGNTTGEKILKLSKLIFPELRSDYIKFSPYYSDHIKWYFKRKFGKSEEKVIREFEL